MQAESNQGSDKWHEERARCITASCFKDVIAYGKATIKDVKEGRKHNGKPLACREQYKANKTIERLIGMEKHDINSKSMSHGKEFEPLAKERYEEITGELISESGFIIYNDYIGCSPDGLVGDDGGVECKCPYDEYIHFMTLINNQMPDEHMPQVQGSMLVTGRQWWDFISYDPRFPYNMQFFLQRIMRDNDYISNLETEINRFNIEIDDYVAIIKGRFKL